MLFRSETRANAKRNWAGKFNEVQGQLAINGGALKAVQEQLVTSGKNTYGGAPNITGNTAIVDQLTAGNADIGGQLAKVAAENKDIEQQLIQRKGAAGNASLQQGAVVDLNGLSQTVGNANTNAAQALLFGNNTYTGNTNINAGNLVNGTEIGRAHV